MTLHEGPATTYIPILGVPWLFPFQAGILGYRPARPGESEPVCVVTGKPIRDANGSDRQEVSK